MFKDKKVIIFDLDGTLIDSVGIWNKTDEILIEKLAGREVKLPNIQQIRDRILSECNSGDIYLEYCGVLGKKFNSNLTPEEILGLRDSISDDYLENSIDYKPYADSLLHLLKENGYTLALATTTTSSKLDIYRNRNINIKSKADIDEIFSLVLSKDDVQEKKPSPEVHHKIMELLGVGPSDCLIIEDSLIGVEAANKAGIHVAVMYDKYSDEDREEINRLSQYQFTNFEQMINRVKSELTPDIERE